MPNYTYYKMAISDFQNKYIKNGIDNIELYSNNQCTKCQPMSFFGCVMVPQKGKGDDVTSLSTSFGSSIFRTSKQHF